MKRAVFALWVFAFGLFFNISSVNAEFLPQDSSEQDKTVIGYASSDEVSLKNLERGEWKGVSPELLCVLKKADSLARRRVGYRFDSSSRPLTREDLKARPTELSCSELVWYVFSVCGIDLGDGPIETKEMAYNKDVYAPFLKKVRHTRIRPGDILVYDYPLKTLQREKALTGKYRSGHAVIVVSRKGRVVIGSHYYGSSPGDVMPGVGYRKLLKGWGSWTAGRKLRAVYRLDLSSTLKSS